MHVWPRGFPMIGNPSPSANAPLHGCGKDHACERSNRRRGAPRLRVTVARKAPVGENVEAPGRPNPNKAAPDATEDGRRKIVGTAWILRPRARLHRRVRTRTTPPDISGVQVRVSAGTPGHRYHQPDPGGNCARRPSCRPLTTQRRPGSSLTRTVLERSFRYENPSDSSN